MFVIPCSKVRIHQAITIMGQLGMTPEEFAEDLGIRITTVKKWQKRMQRMEDGFISKLSVHTALISHMINLNAAEE